MMRISNKTLILLIILVVLILNHEYRTRAVTYGPGVQAPDPPVQKRITEENWITHKDCYIHPMASFQVKGKVLSRKRYLFGRAARLSPIDLALGWGAMSDERILDTINVVQSGRWYRWITRGTPLPRREIETHSANMHMIPSTPEIAKRIKRVREGELIELSGYLVRVRSDDGWNWRSSLTRTDTGDHACEVVYVEEFTRL